ncbi:MAG: type II toxin-antitoxin system death-on-curing family toxin [Alphaproteobacteria bacterium]
MELIRAVHQEMIAEHGGMAGIRDEGLLESALARPRRLIAYGDPDVFELATAYASGIVRDHPFVDGNKRTGLMAAYMFLRLNGYRLVASEVEAAVAFQDLAAGEIDEAMLAKWIEANAEPA